MQSSERLTENVIIFIKIRPTFEQKLISSDFIPNQMTMKRVVNAYCSILKNVKLFNFIFIFNILWTFVIFGNLLLTN